MTSLGRRLHVLQLLLLFASLRLLLAKRSLSYPSSDTHMETSCVSSIPSDGTTVAATSSSSSCATTTGWSPSATATNRSTVETAVVGLREGEHLDSSMEDIEEVLSVDKFMNQGCTCHLGVQGCPCSQQLTRETIEKTRQDCLDLTRSELDIVVLSQIHSLQSTTRQPTLRQSHHAVGVKPRSTFYINGVQVCLDTYLYFHFFFTQTLSKSGSALPAKRTLSPNSWQHEASSR